MKKRIKRIIASYLLVICILGSSFVAYGCEKNVMAEGEIIEITPNSYDDSSIMPRKLYETGEFALGTDNYFSFVFNAKNGKNDPHTKLTIEITDVSGGKWYVKISSTGGYSYTSSEYSTGATITVTNLRSDVEYEVMMLWVPNTNAVRGNYTMWTSYD